MTAGDCARRSAVSPLPSRSFFSSERTASWSPASVPLLLAGVSASFAVDRRPRFGLGVGAGAAAFWIADRLLVIFVDVCPSTGGLGAAAARLVRVFLSLLFDR